MIRNKKYTYLFILIFVIVCFLFAAWLFAPIDLKREDPNLYYSNELQGIEKVNHIELELADGNHLKTINTPDHIKAILEYFRNNYTKGWQYENFFSKSPLRGQVVIIFYNNDQLISILRVGKQANKSYLVYRPLGPGRFLTESEFRELMGLLQIDEDLASQ